ncbi:MAG: glycosyl hydrolase [Verrucomicrobiales bacterium]
MKPTFILVAALLLTPLLVQGAETGNPATAENQKGSTEPLEAGFASPPPEAKPLTWWHWINGNVTKEGIRADLEDMKRRGIGGAQMLDVSIYLPPGPVRYGTDLWHEHVQFAIRTAAELGLELDIMNCAGWSASAGPWITPERSMKQLVWSETHVDGTANVKTKLPRPPTRLNFCRDIAVLAVPWSGDDYKNESKPPRLISTTPAPLDVKKEPIAPEQVLNVSHFMNAEGKFSGSLPPGKWTLLRFGFTTTGSKNHPAQPEGEGLECDKFDAAAVEFQFERALGRIIREAGPNVGKAFKGILFDSFEGGYQNWSDAFPRDFQKLKGYDFLPFMPVFTGRVIGSVEESEAMLRDFRGVVNELMATNYFGTMQRLANRAGLKVYAEAQGGPLNPFLCNRFTDVPMNEFWMPDAAPRFSKMKQIASIVNVSGRSITAAEAFTAKPEDGRWLATPATLKAPGDCAFTAGINRFIFHTYIHQPYSDIAPGFTLGRYGTHFGRLNTWWPLADAWLSYIARCQFLLQKGRTTADIAMLTDVQLGYSLPAKTMEAPAGFDLDVVYPHDLARMTHSNGLLRLPQGSAYRVLGLPEKWSADVATLRQLDALAAAGARIIGPAPAAPEGWRDFREQNAEWTALVEKLWGNPRTKLAGKVPSQSPAQALRELGVVPDCELAVEPATATVRFIHRTTAEAEIYFLSNQSKAPVQVSALFRSGNRVPELWDAVTGQMADAPEYELTSGRARVPLALAANGSIFVIFRRDAPAGMAAVKPPVNATAALNVPVNGPWQVRFQPGRSAPAEIRLEKLISWTEHPDPGVRHFSGIATYETRVNIAEDFKKTNSRCVLRLGEVSDVAAVTINGHHAGVTWTVPFELDVTLWVRAGENALQIAVANRWINRLIGDESLPPDARYDFTGTNFTIGRLAKLPAWLGDPELTKQRQRVTFATWQFYTKDSPLMDSGLLGPVQLELRAETSLPRPE